MDIVVRAIVAFCFVFLLTRLIGRRELSSLQPFDLMLLIVIGDLIQQGITQNDLSVTGLVLDGRRLRADDARGLVPRLALPARPPDPRAGAADPRSRTEA